MTETRTEQVSPVVNYAVMFICGPAAIMRADDDEFDIKLSEVLVAFLGSIFWFNVFWVVFSRAGLL